MIKTGLKISNEVKKELRKHMELANESYGDDCTFYIYWQDRVVNDGKETIPEGWQIQALNTDNSFVSFSADGFTFSMSPDSQDAVLEQISSGKTIMAANGSLILARDTPAVVKNVYQYMKKQDLNSFFNAYQAALKELAVAQGIEVLVLHEAIVHSIDQFLTEFGEHGKQNEALWGGWVSEVDNLDGLNEQFRISLNEVIRLRGYKKESNSLPLIKDYISGWYLQIGSREWLNQMKLILAHRSANADG